jgi:hypothetical protein
MDPTKLTESEKRDLQALDAKIVKLAKKVWRNHPNNPANK